MNPIYSHILVGAICAFVASVLTIHFIPVYTNAKNSMANLTAEEAQSLADIFQSIATRLKTGMYAKGSPLPPSK